MIKKIEQFLNADYDDCVKEKSKSSSDEFGNNLKHNGSRYELKLPSTCSKEVILDNYLLAKIRTEHLLTRLNKNKQLLKKYNDIIKDCLTEGIVEEANNIPKKGRVHYLPHRAVIRNDKETSKIRVVYDASSQVKNEAFLNDPLESDPCLLPLLFDILLRFTTEKIGLISDIKQAFLQIEISPEHRDYLRVLWYDDVCKSNPELIILRFARVLFGLMCSPFLLNGTVKCHLQKHLQNENIAKFIERLLRNLYVNDSTNSFDEKADCIEFYNVAKSTLADAGFELRQWKSNDINLQQHLSAAKANILPENVLIDNSSNDVDNYTKVLGINWDTFNNNFVFEFYDIYSTASALPVTKCNVLKISSTFFDPLGFILPITLPSKLFKNIYSQKFNWDDEVSPLLKRQWTRYLNELNSLGKVSVNRHVLCCHCRDVELHGSCDSSGSAYCAVVYVKTVCCHRVTVNFWEGKSRVVPMKKLNILRLELLACLLLARLMVSVVDAVKSDVSVKDVICWTDSQIAIGG